MKRGRRESSVEILRRHGINPTPQRTRVLDVFKDCPGVHFTNDSLFDELVERGYKIGIATVFRTTQLFVGAGLIMPVDLGDGKMRYELRKTEEEHMHHHLVCRVCGGLFEYDKDLLDELEAKIEAELGFKIEDHSLNFTGICADCQKKLR